MIGAGHAGLATSRVLAERSIDHVVLERGEVANSWRRERWDFLRLLTPNWQARLPGYEYSGNDPDGYMRAPAVPAGLAPKVRITETQTAAHIFDLNFSPGDEIMSGLTDLVLARNITSGHITGLGGLSGALLAWGDPEVGAFKMIRVDEKCELISLLGATEVQPRRGRMPA